MFEKTKEQVDALFDGRIKRLDPEIINEELENFCEKTELNIYAGDGRKITKAIMKSGLIIKSIKHENYGAWNPKVTVVIYSLNANPQTPEEATFRHTWR